MHRNQNRHLLLEEPSQHLEERSRPSSLYAWSKAPGMGYVGAVLFVGILLFIEKLDPYIPQVPVFESAPFGLISILVALIWGTGPALFALVLGLLSISMIISPGIFTPDILRDIVIVAPFLILQLIVIAAVFRLDRSRREILAARQELKAANQLLMQKNKQLERANAQKDYVLTRAAHELKTPLTTIIGRTQHLAHRLRKPGKTPQNWAELQKYIDVVEVRARHLRALIDSLFDLSSVRAEDIPSRLHPCDLGCLCRHVVKHQQQLSERSIELDLPADPIIIAADEKRFPQVIEHLLSNAVNYAPADTPIQVYVHNIDRNGVVQVKNVYPELPSEHLEHIFDPFYRTPNVEYSSIQGWGLGLTICKEIIERHKGSIRVKSSSTNEITFSVEIPLYQEPED